MASNNDFFVKFDSNAKAFAAQLERDLAPARASVAQLQEGLAKLAAQGGSRIPPPATSTAPGSGSGQQLAKLSVSGLQDAIYDQQKAMESLTRDLAAVVRGLREAQTAIKTLPEAVANAKRGLSAQDARNAEIAAGAGRSYIPGQSGLVRTGTPGSIQFGSLEHRIQQALRGQDLSTRPVLPTPSIGTVRRSDIDRANFDRVIAAINKQTQVLESGLKVTGGGRAQASGGATAAAGNQLGDAIEEVGQQAERAERTAEQRLHDLDVRLARMVALVGESGDEAAQAALAELQSLRAATAAEARRAEREATGISQAEQKRRAQEEFAHRPVISDVEKERRLQQAALIASPGASDFDSRLGRARTEAGGNYSREDLLAMRQAFHNLGIAVDANTKATKEELAAALRRAHAQYQRDYPEGHPDLATSGFNIETTTKIGSVLTEMVGDLEGAAYEIQEARKRIRADRQSGGTGEKPTTRLEQVPGTISGPGGFAGNWRPNFGAAIGSAAGLISQQELQEAERRVQADASRMAERAQQLAAQPGFNPYDPSLRSQIKRGQGDEQTALAEAASSALRDLRLATKELDDFGKEVVAWENALAENQAFIDRATRRIREGAAQPDDQEKLLAAQQRNVELRRNLAGVDPQLRQLFQSPGYRAGLERREGWAGIPFAPGVSQRQLYDWRSQGGGRQTLSDWRLLRESTAGAVLGVTTAVGARSVRRNIPGLGFAHGSYFDQNAGGEGAVAPAEIEKINQAANHLEAKRRAFLRGATDATAADLEKAADVFASRIARNFHGLGPNIESLTGQAPVDPEIARRDELRRTAVEQAVAEQNRRLPKKTPQEELDLYSKTLRDATAAHAEAEKRAATAAAELAAIEKQRAAEIKALPAGQRSALDQYALESNREVRAGGQFIRAQGALERGVADPVERERLYNQRENARLIEQEAAKRRASAEAAAGTDQLAQALLDARRNASTAAATVEDLASSVAHAQGNFDRLTAEINAVRDAAARGLNRKQIAEETGVNADRIRSILGPAQKADEAAAVKEADAIKRVTAAANGRISELLRERDAIRASGEYRRSAAKAAFQGGDTAEYDAIRARRAELARIKGELRDLGYEGGAGGGGRVPPTARGGASPGDGGDESILRQILATLKQIHATLRGGVRVSGVSTTEGGTTLSTRRGGLNPTLEEVNLSRGSDEERLRAMELQRQRLERLNNSPDAINRAHTQALAENERRNRANAEAAAQAGRALREQARAEELLRSATAGTSQATRDEIERLRQLGRAAQEAAGDTQKLANIQREIAAQQTRVATAMNAELKSQGLYAADRRKMIGATLSDAGPKVNASELEGIMRSVPRGAFETTGSELGTQMGDAALDGFARTFGGNASFWSRIMHTTGTFIVRNFAAGFVFGLTNVLQDMLTQALEAENTFIRVSDALRATNQEVGDLRGNLSNISQDYGVALNDVYTTAASLTGLFSNAADLDAATRVSTQLQIISRGALNADEAVGVLASTMSAFNLEGADGVEHIADVLTSIQNNLGVNVETTSEGIARMAGLAQQMRISFEETGVFVAAIAKQTNQTGAAAGEQFSRILGSLQTGRGRAAVEEAFGPAVSNLVNKGNYGKALTEMISRWDSLSKSQQQNVAVTLAGQRQMAAFNALMNDSARNLRALDKAQNSQGDAAERVDAILKSLQSRLGQLTAAFQTFASELVQTGILNIVGVALVGITDVLRLVNSVLSNLNEFADSNPLIGWLRDAAGLAIGAAVAFKLLRASINGIGSALGSMRRTAQTEAAVEGAVGAAGATTGIRGAAGVAGTTGTTGTTASRAPLRGGIILGGATMLLRPQLDALGRGLDGAGSRIGRWADSFSPDGRFSRPIYSFGQKLNSYSSGLRDYGAALQTRADQQIRALEATRGAAAAGTTATIGRTPVNNSFTGLARSARLVELSTRGAQVGLTATSRVLGVAGRAAQVTAIGMSKVASGFRAVGAGGLAVDAALIALTIGLSKLAENSQRSGRLAEAAADSYDRLYGVQKKLGAGNGKDAQGNYIGPASEALDAELGSLQEQSQGFWSKFSDSMAVTLQHPLDTFNAAVTAPIGALTGNTYQDKLGKDVEDYYNSIYGIDPATGEPAGAKEARDIQNKMALAATNPYRATDIGQLKAISDTLNSDLEEMASNARDAYAAGDISGNQYASILANVEQADQYINDAIADRKAMLEGLAANTQLTAQQINDLLTTGNLLQQVGNNPLLTTMSGGGLDIGQILQDQIANLGIPSGSRLDQRLQGLLGIYGTQAQALTGVSPSDAAAGNIVYPPDVLQQFAPPSALDLSKAQVGISREAYRQADNLVEQKQSEGADQEEIDQAIQARDQALQAYLQALQGVTDTIYSQADLKAQFQQATGNFQGAMRTQVGAIKAADRMFARQNQLLLLPLRQQQKLYRDVQQQAEDLRRKLLAAGQNPEQNQQYLNLQAILKNTRGDIQRLQRLLRGTAAWRQHAAQQIARVHAAIETAIVKATADLNIRIARASSEELRAALELQKQRIIQGILSRVNAGLSIPGLGPKVSKRWGDLTVTEDEMNQQRVSTIEAQGAYDDAQAAAAEDAASAAEDARSSAAEKRQLRADLKQAQLGVAQAAAEAQGDSVRAAKIQVAMAKAMLGAARADLAAAKTQTETMQARIAVLNAQAQLIAAHAAVQDAQEELVQSQYDVSIAMAEAAGHTVEAARRTLEQARQALRAALQKSHGKNTAEVNAARVTAIQAEAALRDAKLQDDLDTIQFNLEMGRMTQSSAIAALQEILRTRDLTREQRRQLLLQIKGMKEEMADSQWNIGDIKLPTPYQMKRYIEQRRQQFRNELDAAATGSSGNQGGTIPNPNRGPTEPRHHRQVTTSTNTYNFNINGADTAKVKKIIHEVVGGQHTNTRTTGARRGGR